MSDSLIFQARKIIESIVLPSPPKLLFEISAEMAREEPEYAVIIDLISQDLNMTAKIIKVANSPFFGLRYKAATIDTALSVLGLENFKSIVLATSLKDAMKGNNLSLQEFESFYSHSMQVGRAAQFIAVELKAGDAYSNQFFMAGLFHDCGIPMLSQKFPKYMQTIKPHVVDGESVVDVEEAFFRTNHCLVGSFVAKAWQIPEIVCHAIETHHEETVNPRLKPHEQQIHAAILMAEHLVFEASDEMLRKEQIYHHSISFDTLKETIFPVLQLSLNQYKTLAMAVEQLVKETG